MTPNVKHWHSSGMMLRPPVGNAGLAYKYEANENL